MSAFVDRDKVAPSHLGILGPVVSAESQARLDRHCIVMRPDIAVADPHLPATVGIDAI
jgi:hypothetical protein